MAKSPSDFVNFLKNRVVEEGRYLTSVTTDIREYVAEMVDVRTAAAWGQHRLMRVPLAFRRYPDRKWLTVGDNGLDGMILVHQGFQNVTPSSLNGIVLQQLKDAGFIDRFGIENAEDMSWEDAEFDYVLCKQSLHHMQRPFVAIYEMLRVASRAVILIEPQDRKTDAQFCITAPSYEWVGNYVYSINKAELIKLALGANLPAIGFLDFNEAWIEDAASVQARVDSPAFHEMLARLQRRDEKTATGERGYDRLTAVLFHEAPEPALIRSLEEFGFVYHELPGNPYVPDARRRLPWRLFEAPIARLSVEGGYLWGAGEDFGFLWSLFPEIEPLVRTGKVKLVDKSGHANMARLVGMLPTGVHLASDVLKHEIHAPAVMEGDELPIVLTSQAAETRRSMTRAAVDMGIGADRLVDIGYPGGLRVE
jgi:hypothetical protein